MDNAMTSNDKFNEWAKEWMGVSDEQLNCHHVFPVFQQSDDMNCDTCSITYAEIGQIDAAKAAWDARGKYDV